MANFGNKITELSIAGVPVDYVPISWPMYYGVDAELVVIEQGAKRFAEFKQKLRPSGNTIKAKCIKDSGIAAVADDEIEFKKIHCIALVQHNERMMTMTLADRRWLISTFVCPFDFNVKRRNGKYVVETAQNSTTPVTLAIALERMSEHMGIPLTLSGVSGGQALPDNMILNGMKMHEALREILNKFQADLTVDTEGEVKIVDSSAAGGLGLPSKEGHKWLAEPSFFTKARNVLIAPTKLFFGYPQKHQMLASVGAARGSIVKGKIEKYGIEQVYNFKGKYLSLAELQNELANIGLGEITLSENIIADNILTRTWKGTRLDQNAIDENEVLNVSETSRIQVARQLVAMFKRDWRRLFRLKMPTLNDGVWSNIVFGELQSDGTVKEAAVKCTWVEFFPHPSIDKVAGAIVPFKSKWTRNHVSPPADPAQATGDGAESPFKCTWVDQDNLIFKIDTRPPWESSDGAMIGTLDGDVQFSYHAFDYRLKTREETFEEGNFHEDYKLEIKLVGTLRQPNDPDRYYFIEEEGVSNEFADDESVEQDVEVMNEPTANFNSSNVLMNEQQLKDDAKRRRDVVLSRFAFLSDGDADAHGLSLLKLYKHPRGPVARLSLEFGTGGRGAAFMGTRIVVRHKPRDVSTARIVERVQRDAPLTGENR